MTRKSGSMALRRWARKVRAQLAIGARKRGGRGAQRDDQMPRGGFEGRAIATGRTGGIGSSRRGVHPAGNSGPSDFGFLGRKVSFRFRQGSP